MMENIIYNELRYRGYQVDVGTVESREKDSSGKEIRVQREIDFIASLGSKNTISSLHTRSPIRKSMNRERNPLNIRWIPSRRSLSLTKA